MARFLILPSTLAAQIAALAMLHHLGDDPSLQVGTIAASSAPPEDVFMAAARLAALAVAWWLFATTALCTAARAWRLPAALRALEPITLPAVRRLVERSVAVTLTLSAGAATLPATPVFAPGHAAASVAASADPAEVVNGGAVPGAAGDMASATAAVPTGSVGVPGSVRVPGTVVASGPAASATVPVPASGPVAASGWLVPPASVVPPAVAGPPGSGPRPTRPLAGGPPGAAGAGGVPSPAGSPATASGDSAEASVSPLGPAGPAVPPLAARAAPVAPVGEPGTQPDPARAVRSASGSPSTLAARAPDRTAGDGPTARPASDQLANPPHLGQHRVVEGEHLWSVARSVVAAAAGRRPEQIDIADVAAYWVRLVEANPSNLRSGDPDVIHPGEVLDLPPVGA